MRAVGPNAASERGLMRIFVGVFPPAPVQERAAAVIEKLRAPGDGVSWTRTDNLHFTIRFLGDLGETGADRAREAVRRGVAAPEHRLEARHRLLVLGSIADDLARTVHERSRAWTNATISRTLAHSCARSNAVGSIGTPVRSSIQSTRLNSASESSRPDSNSGSASPAAPSSTP